MNEKPTPLLPDEGRDDWWLLDSKYWDAKDALTRIPPLGMKYQQALDFIRIGKDYYQKLYEVKRHFATTPAQLEPHKCDWLMWQHAFDAAQGRESFSYVDTLVNWLEERNRDAITKEALQTDHPTNRAYIGILTKEVLAFQQLSPTISLRLKRQRQAEQKGKFRASDKVRLKIPSVTPSV